MDFELGTVIFFHVFDWLNRPQFFALKQQQQPLPPRQIP